VNRLHCPELISLAHSWPCSSSRMAAALGGSTSTTTATTASPAPPPDNLPAGGMLRLRGRHEVVDGVVRPATAGKGKGKAKDGEAEGEGEAKSDRVTWVEGTVDNEFLGRKSSKSASGSRPASASVKAGPEGADEPAGLFDHGQSAASTTSPGPSTSRHQTSPRRTKTSRRPSSSAGAGTGHAARSITCTSIRMGRTAAKEAAAAAAAARASRTSSTEADGGPEHRRRRQSRAPLRCALPCCLDLQSFPSLLTPLILLVKGSCMRASPALLCPAARTAV
jgi:hypothetical protein